MILDQNYGLVETDGQVLIYNDWAFMSAQPLPGSPIEGQDVSGPWGNAQSITGSVEDPTTRCC